MPALRFSFLRASYISLTRGLTGLLDRIGVKPYSRTHN
jgi:hypothetical protein